jgi:hypothetical protein
MSDALTPDVVHTLTCQRDLKMSLTCLRTLRLALPSEKKIVIHDDGSLSDADFAGLCEAIPNSAAIPRRSIDERVETKLARYPRCRAFRNEHAFSCKLLDVPLSAGSDEVFYCDSDILFIRRPRRWIPPDRGPVFSQDPTDGYSGSLWKLRYVLGLKLPSRLNAGILFIPMSIHDLDFVEWFLGQEAARVVPWLIEQTCWGGLLRGRPTWMFHPDELCGGPPAPGPAEKEAVAIHFMSRARGRLPEFAAKTEACDRLPEADGFRFIKSETMGVRRIVMRPVRRLAEKIFIQRKAAQSG